MNTNMNTSKCETLPKLINYTHKLVEPNYLKNTMVKQQLKLTNNMTSHMKNSIVPNQRTLVVQRLVQSLDFCSRHFGSSCDRGFSNLSNYHQSQKFGLWSIKLAPLEQRNVIADLTDTEVEAIPKDQRVTYKKIYRLKQIPLLFMFRPFIVEFVREFDSPADKSFSKPLVFNYETTLAILNTFDDPMSFFTHNIQLLEGNQVSIKQKALNSLKYTVNRFSVDELPLQLTIRDDKGYYRINFPCAQLYVQERQYTQQVAVSPVQAYNLIKVNFNYVEDIIDEFDMEQYNNGKQQIRGRRQSMDMPVEQTPLPEPISINIPAKPVVVIPQEPEQAPIVQAPIEQTPIEQTPIEQTPIIEPPPKQHIGIAICDEKTNFPEEVWKKKMIKKVSKLNNLMYTVNFTPTYVVVREKVSGLLVKTGNISLRQFSNLLKLLETKTMPEILMDHVNVVVDLPPESFDYKDFRRATTVTFNIPEQEEVVNEVGDLQLEHGLIEDCQRMVEINNKDLTITIEPSYFEIYEQTLCFRDKRICSIHELNQLLSRKFVIGLKLV